MVDYTLYPFKTVPFEHQWDDFDRSKDLHDYALFWEMGTGKSKNVIDTFCYLYMKQEIDVVLYLAKKGEYRNFLNEEMPAHMWDTVSWRGVNYSSILDETMKDSVRQIVKGFPDKLRFLAINVESLPYQGEQVAKAFLSSSRRGKMVISDEVTWAKNWKAKRSKVGYSLADRADYRRIMTGTPVARSPLDIFGEAQMLAKGITGHRSYFSFKGDYAIEEIKYFGEKHFKGIKGYKNLDRLNRTIRSFGSIRTRAECVDLPPKIYRRVPVEMTKEQAVMYSDMRDMAIAQFGDGELKEATSYMGVFMNLHQICLGQLKREDGTVEYLPTNRFDAVFEKYEDVDDKAIIWCNFRGTLERLCEEAEERYGKGSFARYYGGVPDDVREEGLKDFKNPDSQCRFWVSNQQSGGYGQTIVIAKISEYVSNDFNLERRLQSEDRNMRIGQDVSVLYNDYYCPGTVEERIVNLLREKKNLAHAVLGTKITDWI